MNIKSWWKFENRHFATEENRYKKFFFIKIGMLKQIMKARRVIEKCDHNIII